MDNIITAIRWSFFRSCPGPRATLEDISDIAKSCNLGPLYRGSLHYLYVELICCHPGMDTSVGLSSARSETEATAMLEERVASAIVQIKTIGIPLSRCSL